MCFIFRYGQDVDEDILQGAFASMADGTLQGNIFVLCHHFRGRTPQEFPAFVQEEDLLGPGGLVDVMRADEDGHPFSPKVEKGIPHVVAGLRVHAQGGFIK